MRNFEVLERGNDYFVCQVDGMHCRIVIDEFSSALTIGEHRLHVEEVSDRYVHHSKDGIFRLTLPLEEQDSIAICTLNAGPRNQFTYRSCLKLGGKWEPILNEWVFSASVSDKVDQLRQIIHSPKKILEVTFKETISMPNKSLSLFGFELVKGIKRNHEPIFHRGVCLKKGTISYVVSDTSKTVALAGSIVRLTVPEGMLEDKRFKEEYFAALDYRMIKSSRKRF